MFSPIFEYALMVFGVAFATWVLRVDHAGPFAFWKKRIVLTTDNIGRPYEVRSKVNIFDWLRRLFGAYEVETQGDGTQWWILNQDVVLWTCPYCLSFWTQIPLILLFVVTWNPDVLFTASVILATPLFAGLINEFIDYVGQRT